MLQGKLYITGISSVGDNLDFPTAALTSDIVAAYTSSQITDKSVCL